MTCRRVAVSLRGPGQSPVLPFACCVGSLRSVGRCGRCSCWCRFRVRGAQSLVCWGLCWLWRDVPFVRQRRPVVGVARGHRLYRRPSLTSTGRPTADQGRPAAPFPKMTQHRMRAWHCRTTVCSVGLTPPLPCLGPSPWQAARSIGMDQYPPPPPTTPCARLALTSPVRMLRWQQVSRRIVREGGGTRVARERCVLAL